MDKREDLKQKEGKKKEVYLTTRLLESLAKKAFKEAAKETMRVMGYNVIAQDGWVVKKFADGSIVRLHELEEVRDNGEILLD